MTHDSISKYNINQLTRNTIIISKSISEYNINKSVFGIHWIIILTIFMVRKMSGTELNVTRFARNKDRSRYPRVIWLFGRRVVYLSLVNDLSPANTYLAMRTHMSTTCSGTLSNLHSAAAHSLFNKARLRTCLSGALLSELNTNNPTAQRSMSPILIQPEWPSTWFGIYLMFGNLTKNSENFLLCENELNVWKTYLWFSENKMLKM